VKLADHVGWNRSLTGLLQKREDLFYLDAACQRPAQAADGEMKTVDLPAFRPSPWGARA
jgi:hypothetical protein